MLSLFGAESVPAKCITKEIMSFVLLCTLLSQEELLLTHLTIQSGFDEGLQRVQVLPRILHQRLKQERFACGPVCPIARDITTYCAFNPLHVEKEEIW